MKDAIEFLSGNVPGGFGLYLSIILLVFLVLFSISRRNDLFTPRHFKIWFAAAWIVITAIYIIAWKSNPPPTVYTRYSTLIFAEEEADRWLAYYLRDEISKQLKPFRNSTHYLYLQRWNHYTNIDCALAEEEHCERIARKLPLNDVIVGQIRQEHHTYKLELTYKEFPGEEIVASEEFTFASNSPHKIIPELRQWLSQHFSLRKEQMPPSLADPRFILAKEAFFKREYQKCEAVFSELLKRYPENEEVKKWHYYNEIQLAGLQRAQDKSKNPYQYKKAKWQHRLESARTFLIRLIKEDLTDDIDDVLLASMIAESFIQGERYKNAEEFLKIAYHANPFSMAVLENLSLLHPSRYKDLRFSSEEELLTRILNICPVNEQVLNRYVEKLLVSVPVNQTPSAAIEEYIRRTLSLNPSSVMALVLRGRYFIANFGYPKALDSFLKADSLDPENSIIQYNIGVAYYKQKKYEKAESYFQKAIQKDDYLNAHLYLGVIYQNRGEYEKALQEFRYRVANKKDEDDYYAVQAMKGIRECLDALNIPIPQ